MRSSRQASTVEALIQKAHPGSDALAPFVDLLVADPFARLTEVLEGAAGWTIDH